MYPHSCSSTISPAFFIGRTICCIFISQTPRSRPGWGTSTMSTPPAIGCCAQARIRVLCWLTWQLRNTRWAVMSPGYPWSRSRCRSSSCCPKTSYFKATGGALDLGPRAVPAVPCMQASFCTDESSEQQIICVFCVFITG